MTTAYDTYTPSTNHPILTVYVRNKRHKGHYATAMLLLMNGYQHIQSIHGKQKGLSGSYSVLLALGYLYQSFRQYPVNIYVVHFNLLNILKNLGYYKSHNWPTTEKTSSELYQEAKQKNTNVDLSKLPKNYIKFIPVYKRLAKALPYFTQGVRFFHTNSQSPHIQYLARFLDDEIGHLPPTADYLNQQNKHLTVNLSTSVKQKFLMHCKNKDLDYQTVVQHLISNYLKTSNTKAVKSKPKVAKSNTVNSNKSKAKDKLGKHKNKSKSKSKK